MAPRAPPAAAAAAARELAVANGNGTHKRRGAWANGGEGEMVVEEDEGECGARGRRNGFHGPGGGGWDESIVGSRIRVFWEGEEAWFHGRVIRFNSRTHKHSILYDDGDTETACLEKMQFELLQ